MSTSQERRWIEAQWPAPPNIRACTYTRELDCAPDRGQLAAWLGIELSPDFVVPQLEQIHGKRVVDLADVHDWESPPQADACYSAQALQLCCVRTADCLPVLLCDHSGSELAAVHAGWRGLVDGVIEATLERFQAPAGSIMAWLGPAISQASFEVGSEVRDVFVDAAAVPDKAATLACFEARGSKYMADLPALARRRLQRAGVSQVFGSDRCTYAEADFFHSYRRDGDAAGRLYSVVIRTG